MGFAVCALHIWASLLPWECYEVKDCCDLHLIADQLWVKLSPGHVGVTLTNPSPISKALWPGLSSRVWKLHNAQGSALRQTPILGLMLYCCHLEILNFMCWTSVLKAKSDGKMRHTHQQRKHAWCSSFHATPFAHSVHVAPWSGNSGGPMICGTSVSQRKR